jgi:hypothetical protein
VMGFFLKGVAIFIIVRWWAFVIIIIKIAALGVALGRRTATASIASRWLTASSWIVSGWAWSWLATYTLGLLFTTWGVVISASSSSATATASTLRGGKFCGWGGAILVANIWVFVNICCCVWLVFVWGMHFILFYVLLITHY